MQLRPQARIGKYISLLSRVFILAVALGLPLPPAGWSAPQPAVHKGMGKPQEEVSGWEARRGARYQAPGPEVLVAKAQTTKKRG